MFLQHGLACGPHGQLTHSQDHDNPSRLGPSSPRLRHQWGLPRDPAGSRLLANWPNPLHWQRQCCHWGQTCFRQWCASPVLPCPGRTTNMRRGGYVGSTVKCHWASPMLPGENFGRRGLHNPPEPRMDCLVVSSILTLETSTCVGMVQMQITLRPPD